MVIKVSKDNLISNNVLAVLLAITIIFSITGTLISLSRMEALTGAAAAVGTVNVTVNESAGISLSQSAVNFTTSDPGVNRITTTGLDIQAGPFNLTNDGTVLVNVTIGSTALFSVASANTLPNRFYSYNITHILTGDGIYIGNCSYGMRGNNLICGNNASCGAWRAMVATAAAETAICRLNFTDGSDSVLIQVNITVPSDEPAGTRNANVTFTSSKG
ncbi:MAG TPA: hypothetical protein VJJ23_05125 [Candidatus Nanoarchaeia archaeon]|nr:hypothetical protein [Candidatus Nanoarchaeia archaeon]